MKIFLFENHFTASVLGNLGQNAALHDLMSPEIYFSNMSLLIFVMNSS
jgi:hypothetical protein